MWDGFGHFPFIFTRFKQGKPKLELSKVLVHHTDGNKRSIDARTYAVIEHSGLENNVRSMDETFQVPASLRISIANIQTCTRNILLPERINVVYMHRFVYICT